MRVNYVDIEGKRSLGSGNSLSKEFDVEFCLEGFSNLGS